MPSRLSLTLLITAVVLLGGCDSADPGPTVDFDRLFAPPTQDETSALLAEWGDRSQEGAYLPGAVTVAYDDDLLGDGSRVLLISHTTGSSTATHHGAVRVPPGEGPFPVIVAHHGGDQGFSLADHLAILEAPDGPFLELGSEAIAIFPTYRSETMRDTPLGTLVSGGSPSPWDRDVDDSLALLNATLDVLGSLADASRVGTVGFSRGGGVALLMAARPLPPDAPYQIAGVVNFFGVTDLFTPTFRNIAETVTFSDSPLYANLPGVPFLRDNVLRPLRDGTITYEEARIEAIRRSVVYFAERLPATQAHHHHRDLVVPFEQFESLQARASLIGGPTEFFAYGTPGNLGTQYHNPAAMPESYERTEGFLFEHVIGGVLALLR